jgi:hypothetical protein
MDALPPFNPDSALRRGTVSVVIGHRNAGKSWLVRDLLTRGADPPTGGLWVGDEHLPQMPPSTQRAEEFSPDLLRSFLENHRGDGSFVVYDNCIYDSTVFAMPAFRATLQNSRTWNLRVFLTMLYPMGIPPALRACVDFVFLFREGIASNARRIADSWFIGGATGRDLEHVRQLLQEPYRCDHDCLVLDTQTEQLYRYCVLPPRPAAGLVPPTPLFPFDLTTIRPGDLCLFSGAGFKTPVACAILRTVMAQNPQMAGGYIEPRESIFPLATGNYASICHRTAVYATQYPRSAALANFLLDVSGPSFVLLDDNWFDTRALPYEFLWAHRRERQLLTLVAAAPLFEIHCHAAGPPDFHFFFHPGARQPWGLPPEIPAAWLWDLDYLRHECIVLDTRTRHVSRFTP